MLVLCPMASIACPPALSLFHHQHGISRASQDWQPLLSAPGMHQEIAIPSVLILKPNEQEDLFKSASGFYGCNQLVKWPIRETPLFVDPQEMAADSILFSFRVDEQCPRYKQMLQFLMSKSNKMEDEYLDPSILPELMGHHTLTADMHLQHVVSGDSEFIICRGDKSSLLHPAMNCCEQGIDPALFLDFPSTISVQSDGQFPVFGKLNDMKDMISVLEEFNLRKVSAQWKQQKVLVPHFRWSTGIHEDFVHPSSLSVEAVTAVPFKSPGKVKPKRTSKKKNKKSTKERDLYRSNSFHACESLLSLMMERKRNGKSVINSLKKSGPELPQLLTQISATIAGTGLAVIFSVIYKMACGSVPFSPSNLLSSGFGIGLFWVSWAVNKLRDTIVCVGKNSAKLGFREEEMVTRVDKSVNDIIFRTVASMVMLMLRFA